MAPDTIYRHDVHENKATRLVRTQSLFIAMGGIIVEVYLCVLKIFRPFS